MKKKILVVMLALSLVCAFSGIGAAAPRGMYYSLDQSDRGFKSAPDPEPSGAAVFFDGLVARPVGAITTGFGCGLYVLTLPWSIPSGSTEQMARGVIGKPGGWTFKRPMGRSDARYEEPGVFGR